VLNFRWLVRKAVLDVAYELHGFVVAHMVLDPGVDVKCAFDSIFWVDHELTVGQQPSSENGNCQLMRIRRESP